MTSNSEAIAVIDLGDFSRPGGPAAAARFAQRKLGGQTLIMRMARRITECELIHSVQIVGSHIPASLLGGNLPGVTILNLPSSHACERLASAADRTNAEWVVCLPANYPFVDAELIDRLVATATADGDYDYVGYGDDAGDCRRIQRLGLAGEVCHVDTLRRLRRHARALSDRDGSVAAWLAAAEEQYRLKFIPLPAALDRDDLRFTIEDELDWDDVELLCETVTHAGSQWDELTQLVSTNSGLRRSMELRNG